MHVRIEAPASITFYNVQIFTLVNPGSIFGILAVNYNSRMASNRFAVCSFEKESVSGEHHIHA